MTSGTPPSGPPAAPPSRVPAGGLAAYALLALPLTMTALPINILLPEFYSRETGLALTTIGLVLLATRLVDAVADPLLGAWVDRQKGGRPGGGYLRPTLTGAREGAGLIGVLFGGALPGVLGFGALGALFLVLLALALWALWRHAPGVPAAGTAPAGNPFATFVVPLATSRFRWLLAVFALNAIAPSITATVFQFFVADRLGLPDHVGLFLALYFIAGAASMPMWIRLAQRFSLQAVWLGGMVAAVVAFVWAYGLGPGALWPFAAICVLSGLAFGADLALPPALLARVIDANQHGGREGSYFGLWNFVNKLCLALAGGIALPLLEALGYTRGAQDAAALGALAITYAVVPCLLKLVAAALLWTAWRGRQRRPAGVRGRQAGAGPAPLLRRPDRGTRHGAGPLRAGDAPLRRHHPRQLAG